LRKAVRGREEYAENLGKEQGQLPPSLRETAMGGLAATRTARR